MFNYNSNTNVLKTIIRVPTYHLDKHQRRTMYIRRIAQSYTMDHSWNYSFHVRVRCVSFRVLIHNLGVTKVDTHK